MYRSELMAFTPPTGTQMATTSLEFQLIPNPAESFTQIVLPGQSNQEKRWVISDALGRTVAQGQSVQPQIPVSTAQLAAGMYIVRVEAGNAVGIKKLVIE